MKLETISLVLLKAQSFIESYQKTTFDANITSIEVFLDEDKKNNPFHFSYIFDDENLVNKNSLSCLTKKRKEEYSIFIKYVISYYYNNVF